MYYILCITYKKELIEDESQLITECQKYQNIHFYRITNDSHHQ